MPGGLARGYFRGDRIIRQRSGFRFHNVVASLMLGKPTIAISYGAKHESLMEDPGWRVCTPIKTLDHERLAGLFTELSDRAPHLGNMLRERKAASELLLAEQFAKISHANCDQGVT